MCLILLSLLLCLCCSIASGLDNGLARLPPMGWQSWSKFFCQVDCEADPGNCINEQLYKEMADRMVEDGYLDAGYQFVNIDDCWMAHERTAEGRLASNGTRFPSGIPALADYIHSKGLLLGIYGDIGNITCEGYPGNWDHLREDAQTYAQWEVDFLKLDGCNSGDGDDWPKLMPGGYMDMSRELNASGRPIVYSCSWPAYLGGPNWTQESLVDYQLIGQHCNLWRNYGDIVAPKGKPTWRVILKIINFFARYQDKFGQAQRAGQWNDPDVILAGNAELTERGPARAQMTIWAMWSAPLLMSNDLRQIPAAHREILLNKRVIAVDQDPLGVMGRLVVNETNAWIFVKEMTPMVEGTQFGTLYSYAFAVLNPENATTTQMAVQLASIGLLNPRGYLLQDLWSGQQLGHFQPSDVFKTSVGPTSAVMVKATLAGLELEGNEVYN